MTEAFAVVRAVLDELAPAIYRVGAVASGAVMGVGSAVIAQAEGAPLELIGGGIIGAFGLISLRMVLTAAKAERQSATTIVTRLENRIEDLEGDLATERKRSARLLVAYDRERRLRLSLEAAGFHDRRDLSLLADGAELVEPSDSDELAEYLHDGDEAN